MPTISHVPPGNAHAVYIARNHKGAVLYVGYSSKVISRLGQHQARSPWWRYARDIEVQDFGLDRDAAMLRERRLIGKYQPPYNTAGRDKESLALQRSVGKLACDTCATRVATHAYRQPGFGRDKAGRLSCAQCVKDYGITDAVALSDVLADSIRVAQV